jgi:cobalt-zinc-cadmium efflux system outer membrane protein
LTEGYAFSNQPGSSFLNSQELVFRVEQELETGGRRARRVEGAQIGVEAARAELRDRWRQLQLDVRRSYFSVVLAKADYDVATLTLNDIDQLITVNKARLEQGEISGVEMRRLQVERFRFADDRFASELALKNARGALLALLALTPLDQAFETTDALASGPSAPDTAPSTDGAWLSQALASRPDLDAVRRERDRAQSDLRLQQAMRGANPTLGAGYRRDFGSGGLVLDLKVPLGLFDRNQGGIARADADRRAADARVAAVEIAVALDVQHTRNGLEIHKARVAYVEREYLKNAREARDIVLASYRAGAATLTDYLDAQRALREAQRVANRAQFDYRLSVFQMDAALGRSTPLPEDRRERNPR